MLKKIWEDGSRETEEKEKEIKERREDSGRERKEGVQGERGREFEREGWFRERNRL